MVRVGLGGGFGFAQPTRAGRACRGGARGVSGGLCRLLDRVCRSGLVRYGALGGVRRVPLAISPPALGGVGGGVGGMQLTGGEVISGAGRAEDLLHRECARGLCDVGLGV